MKRGLLIAGIILVAAFTQLHAQTEDGWIVIAEKTASFKSDIDKISPKGEKRNVSKIKIKCIQGTLKLKHVHVTMTDGTKKSYDAKGIGILNKGMSSFAFDLPGKDTKLQHIELEYDSAGNILISKKAKVQVLGKKRKNKDKDK